MRALMVYLPLRLAIFVFSANNGDGTRLSVDSPAGIVLLTAILGFIDTGLRRDRLLWANLGYGMPLVVALFGAVSAIGEVVTALLRP